jgi:hypothetical protein
MHMLPRAVWVAWAVWTCSTLIVGGGGPPPRFDVLGWRALARHDICMCGCFRGAPYTFYLTGSCVGGLALVFGTITVRTPSW